MSAQDGKGPRLFSFFTVILLLYTPKHRAQKRTSPCALKDCTVAQDSAQDVFEPRPVVSLWSAERVRNRRLI